GWVEARDDETAKPGCEAIELSLDSVGHVDRRAGRHVAVGPRRLLPRRRAGRIPTRVLRGQRERAIGCPTGRDLALRADDVLHVPTEVDRPRTMQGLIGPW